MGRALHLLTHASVNSYWCSALYDVLCTIYMTPYIGYNRCSYICPVRAVDDVSLADYKLALSKTEIIQSGMLIEFRM